MKRRNYLIPGTITIILLMVCFLFIFKMNIMSFFYSHRYATKIDHLKNTITILSEDNYEHLKKLCTSDSNVLRPTIFANLKEVFKGIDLNTLEIRYFKEEKKTDKIDVFMIVSFANFTGKDLHVKMIKQKSKLLIDLFSITEFEGSV